MWRSYNAPPPTQDRIILSADFSFSPELLLAMWAGGVAGASAVTAWWRIVGPGYTWLSGATVAAIGLGGWLLDDRPTTLVGVVAGAAAVVLARRPVPAALALGGSALAFLISAGSAGSWPLAVTGTLALGGVTAEMLLGHWYLVSPQMPRWALQRLDLAGAAGLTVDAGILTVITASRGEWGAAGWAFAALALVSIVLMVAVWFALKEPSYPGVMAATGLSYLAVLTSLGAASLGRAIVGGGGSFFSLP